MDAKLLGKLTCAEEELVSAMLTGDMGLVAYDFTWTALLDGISQAAAFGEINSTTFAVADDVVARVSTLVDCCLTLSSVPPPSLSILNLNTCSPSTFHTTSSFIPEAHSWLLENVANPYPSSEFKVSLAQRYNTPISAVNSWFANARRRIGWTALCRDFFRNCRADAVDAAYQVLVMGEPNHQCSAITHAFVALKVTAEGLYETSTKSALAGDLDTAVKDVLLEDKVLARDGGHARKAESLKTRKQSTRTLDKSSQKNSTRQIHYLPSDLSYPSAPVPGLDDSLTDESEDEEDTSPPLLAGRKRRLSLSEPAHVASYRVTTESVKRPRYVAVLIVLAFPNPRNCPSYPSLSSPPTVCLPSTSTSTEDSFENDSQGQTLRSVPIAEGLTNPNMHKRCLSNADTIGSPKRPPDSMARLCSHAVSDPLPLSTLESEVSIDEWFKTNFDALFALPLPVDVIEPDLSTQWEVELFSNYSIPENPQKVLTPGESVFSFLGCCSQRSTSC